MSRSLPTNPTVRFLQIEAKKILRAHRNGDKSICGTYRLMKRYSGFTDQEILKEPMSLQETQLSLALDYGFKSWKELKAHVESTRSLSGSSDGGDHRDLADTTMDDDTASRQTRKPIDSGDLGRDLVAILRPETFAAEQIRKLKSNLLFPSTGTSPRSVMVTSAVPGEGKSFVAANLAASIAQNINEYALLVDCDMRKPSMHEYFGYDRRISGLSDYLADNIPLSSLLLKTPIDKLTVLPAGQPPRDPTELASSTKMSHLFRELSSRYSDRYIIVDSGTPIMASEASVIARQVDGVILVVKFGSTRKPASDLTDMIGKERIIGTFLNRDDVGATPYGYEQRYYRSYSYYAE